MGKDLQGADVKVKLLWRAPVLAGLTALSLQGCDAFHTESRTVGDRTFRLPQRYLMQNAVPWLPRSQASGLLFALNPKEPLAQQHVVLVQTLDKLCPPAQAAGPTQSIRRLAAAVQAPARTLTPPFEKVHVFNDLSQWEYHGPAVNGAASIVATCYALGDAGGDGLCTALQPYKSLIYVIGFRDSEIAQLPSYEQQTATLLAKWDRSR